MNPMMALALSNGGSSKQYVDDVFSAYTYTGNASTKTITNGIDLAGKGGLVWTKLRSGGTVGHRLFDTLRGNNYLDTSDSVGNQGNSGISSYNSNGFTLSNAGSVNASGYSYISWTFQNAAKFFKQATVVKSSGSNATVDLSSLGVVGMVAVKRTDAAGDWYVFHRSATSGKLLLLNYTNAEATLGHITLSGTTLNLVNGVISDGTYVVYAWAHDSSADGLIQCGTFTTDGSGATSVNLGWEPQFVLVKAINTAGGWTMLDQSRGYGAESGSSADRAIDAQSDSAETNVFRGFVTATGFASSVADPMPASLTTVYMAIRRSNKPPTSGTQVYNAVARTGTNAAATITGIGFSADALIATARASTSDKSMFNRLMGREHLPFNDATIAGRTPASGNDLVSWDMDGVSVGVQAQTAINLATTTIDHFFKRTKGAFDVVMYRGDGATGSRSHSLGVTPELILERRLDVADNGHVFHSGIGKYGPLVNGIAFSTTTKSLTTTTFDSWYNMNGSRVVVWLFASLSGISKVGSYTGNGSSQNIDCGFSSGARFVLIKRTDNTSDYYVFDSTRGIVAGNDPHLSLNTIAAEVTTDDSIDPLAAGFTVNQDAATNINVNAASYIFLAIA